MSKCLARVEAAVALTGATMSWSEEADPETIVNNEEVQPSCVMTTVRHLSRQWDLRMSASPCDGMAPFIMDFVVPGARPVTAVTKAADELHVSP